MNDYTPNATEWAQAWRLILSTIDYDNEQELSVWQELRDSPHGTEAACMRLVEVLRHMTGNMLVEFKGGEPAAAAHIRQTLIQLASDGDAV